ncbi:endospore germination permease [Fictibacillus phosphorivorans]|uniref:endospore germination permease n=1 Tax=Fictibacillus phosphorivorans TaxID=1221500 RepID=UPI00129409C8|nr:endospore germination permease [Fictibacillus phosphorivorans]MQR97577.1 hypothetical protein [Fictibacillus phosphorivorans]
MRIQPGVAPLHIYFLLILSSGLVNHVLIIPVILSASGRDAWISILISIVPYLLFILLIGSVLKKIGTKSFTTYIKERIGVTPYYLISAIFILYFYLNAIITFRDTITWTKTNYLPDSPALALGLLLGTLCLAATYKGLQDLAIVSIFILPIVGALGIFIAIGNFQHKDYSMLLPIAEHGWTPIVKGSAYAMSGLSELCTLLFLAHSTNRKLKWRHIFLVAFILMGLMLGPTMAAIAEFGPYEANNLRYPAFEQWKLLTISKEITRMDFLSIFQWISGAFIRISLLMLLVLKLINIKKHKIWIVIALYGSAIAYALAPLSNITIFHFLYDYFFPIQLFIIIPFVVLISLIVLLKK